MDKTVPDFIILSALAEIRKHQVIQAKFNNQTKDMYPDSYVYAIGKSVYPIFQVDSLDNCYESYEKLLSYPFHKIYKITYEKVTEVHQFLTKEWGEKRKINFTDLEKNYKSV